APARARTPACARQLSSLTTQPLDGHHPPGAPAERDEAGAVQRLVVTVIDEHLRRPRVRPSHRECDRAAAVALHERIVLERVATPRLCDLRLAMQTELCDEARHDAEKPVAIVVAGPDEVVEPVRGPRRPPAVDL